MSNNLTKVEFNKPICISIDAPKPAAQTPAAGTTHTIMLSHSEIQQLVRGYIERGIDERAVVVLASHSKYAKMAPYNWGVVMDLHRCNPSAGPYYPLSVKWVKDGSVTKHWPEDVIIIHESISTWETEQRVKIPEFDETAEWQGGMEC